MDKPLVSVCIPTYNNEDTIEETVSSVLRQTWKNLELVIVDDGSSDRTYELVTELAAEDKRIRLYRNGEILPTLSQERPGGRKGDLPIFRVYQRLSWGASGKSDSEECL